MTTHELTTLYDRLMSDSKAEGLPPNVSYYIGDVCKTIDILIGVQQLAESGDLPTTRFLYVENLEELQELRKKLRAAFGTWQDKLTEIRGTNLEHMRAIYEGLHDIHIEMTFDGNDPPEGLIPPTCRIEEETIPTTTYSHYTLRCEGTA